jgi:hypothetical protein
MKVNFKRKLYFIVQIVRYFNFNGGLKGSSVAHYLIDFINFVLYNQDLKDMHAVLAVAVDFSKAFNRVNHNIVIE